MNLKLFFNIHFAKHRIWLPLVMIIIFAVLNKLVIALSRAVRRTSVHICE